MLRAQLQTIHPYIFFLGTAVMPHARFETDGSSHFHFNHMNLAWHCVLRFPRGLAAIGAGLTVGARLAVGAAAVGPSAVGSAVGVASRRGEEHSQNIRKP